MKFRWTPKKEIMSQNQHVNVHPITVLWVTSPFFWPFASIFQQKTTPQGKMNLLNNCCILLMTVAKKVVKSGNHITHFMTITISDWNCEFNYSCKSMTNHTLFPKYTKVWKYNGNFPLCFTFSNHSTRHTNPFPFLQHSYSTGLGAREE